MSLSTMTVNAGGSRMGAIGSSFAYDLVQRISRSNGLDDAQNADMPQTDEARAVSLAEKRTQLQKLERALAGTVEYMRDTHGEKAASIMIALVYKRLGDDAIREESFGKAFLDVTRFIDKNFGANKGDDFMAHLNGSLNNSMNAFFDNGLNETFMVAPTSVGNAGGVSAQGILEEITEQMMETVKAMLEEARAKRNTEKGQAAAYTDPEFKEPLIGIMRDIMV